MKPIQRIPVTDQVVASLRELIVSGKLKVGDKLPTEMEICVQLQVGRSTVREALRVLKALGFVDIVPGKGAFVAKTSEEDPNRVVKWFEENEMEITDFLEVRSPIEVFAVRLAVERITEKEIEELETIRDRFEEAVARHDVIKLITYDEAFHKAIVASTRNRLLISIYEIITKAFTDYRAHSFSVKANAENAVEPHRRIFAAIRERDADRAAKEIAKHIDMSIQDIYKVIQKRPEGVRPPGVRRGSGSAG